MTLYIYKFICTLCMEICALVCVCVRVNLFVGVCVCLKRTFQLEQIKTLSNYSHNKHKPENLRKSINCESFRE